MRLTRSLGRNMRSTTAAPYDIPGGADGNFFMVARSVGAIGVLRLCALSTASEAATTRPGQQVSVATASSGVSSVVHGAPRGIYEGTGGNGAENSTVSYAGATTTIFPGRAAITGDVIELLQKGTGFGCAFDSTTNGANAVVIGDILGVATNSTAEGDGILRKISTQGTTQLLARISALEANTTTSTTGVGWATKVLVNFG